VIYIHDLGEGQCKKKFEFNYGDSINDAKLHLHTVRWSPFDSQCLLAYSASSFVVIMRAPCGDYPIFYKVFAFDAIEAVSFFPFSSNRTPPAYL
jgi:hypothetical protein